MNLPSPATSKTLLEGPINPSMDPLSAVFLALGAVSALVGAVLLLFAWRLGKISKTASAGRLVGAEGRALPRRGEAAFFSFFSCSSLWECAYVTPQHRRAAAS